MPREFVFSTWSSAILRNIPTEPSDRFNKLANTALKESIVKPDPLVAAGIPNRASYSLIVGLTPSRYPAAHTFCLFSSSPIREFSHSHRTHEKTNTLCLPLSTIKFATTLAAPVISLSRQCTRSFSCSSSFDFPLRLKLSRRVSLCLRASVMEPRSSGVAAALRPSAGTNEFQSSNVKRWRY